MEYNLLKTIEPNLGLQMCPIRNPHLTPYPAIDYVNPGLGNAARLYSFYVPLYTNQSPFNISKKEDNSISQERDLTAEAISQEGGSMDAEQSTNDNNSFTEKMSDSFVDPVEFNNRKRKIMGDAIQSSFMHPKVLTGKLNFEPVSKVKKRDISVKVENKIGKGQSVKHKFKFD